MMNVLDKIVFAQKRGEPRGITSICSANHFVLTTAIAQGFKTEHPILIESTCNQVNQFGGYTGMTPADFRNYVYKISDQLNFPKDRIILGGDHLGPNPWQGEPATVAMEKACTLVRDYVNAGYTKIHLDASMRLSDDPPGPLSVDMVAERSADLAVVAEDTARKCKNHLSLRYVIGTEVPIAGGLQDDEEELRVTKVSDLQETIEKSHKAFRSRGLEAAWERVIAIVVQPGVEYGNSSIYEYNRSAATELSRFIEKQPFIYEAHSTDYQTPRVLHQLVGDHFAILKVGPALTFALREAFFGLAMMENEIFSISQRSNLIEILEKAMLVNPIHWQKHNPGDEKTQAFARKFSFSDRSRYYWSVPVVNSAVERLLLNLQQNPLPLAVISQFLPRQFRKIRNGHIKNDPLAIVQDSVVEVILQYQSAVGDDKSD
jgi:D-tagatose-1,6-bisphosphate aldolase subunit GatZ/KbaZ